MRIVLDTNVVVSRFLSPKGPPAEIFVKWQQETFEVVVSESILAEYAQVLEYEKLRARHGLSHEEIANLISDMRRFAVLINPQETPRVVRDDPEDDKFLSCAMAGGADYVISGDDHLLKLQAYRGIQILSPRAFLLMLSSIL